MTISANELFSCYGNETALVMEDQTGKSIAIEYVPMTNGLPSLAREFPWSFHMMGIVAFVQDYANVQDYHQENKHSKER